MNWEMIQGIVRHFLTFGGGFLVTNGTLGQSDMEAGVGAVITIVGIVWSVFTKKKAKEAA